MKTKLLLGLLLTTSFSFAQILHESFDYVIDETLTGQSLTGVGTWANYSGGSPDDILIVAEPTWGSFGTPTSTGNAIQWKGGGSDLNLSFPEVNSGVIYYSFLLQVDQYNTAGTHEAYRQVHLQNASGNTGASVYFDGVDGDDTKFIIGAGTSDVEGDVVWSSVSYDIGSQHLIVVSYDLDDAERTMKMWIDPVVSSTEPTEDISAKPSEKLRNEFVSIAIQASSNARTPETTIDELRVATSWEDVVPVGATASVKDVLASKFDLFPNPAKETLRIQASDVELTSIQVYSVLGKEVYASKTVMSSIDVSNFAKGMYLLKLNTASGSATKKIIVE